MSAEIAAMRLALQRTWYPFFARFPRPTEVQLAAWEPLLGGQDCLVMAATASGKTEAAVAPLLERHLPPGAAPHKPALIIVSPTRALVNDLCRRLEAPLARLKLNLHRRTGDNPVMPRGAARVLVTTPESLDSLLVRHPGLLGAARALLLDELHILDGSPRGDQLCVLVQRFRSLLRGRPLQCVVTSATLHDPDGISRRFLVQGRQVRVDAPPDLDACFFYCPRPGDVVRVVAELWTRGEARKVLVFLDRRADVEALTSRASLGLTGEITRVYAHHGSLSRAERERVEARFLDDPSAVCFATMTLELGINIGDVDMIVQVGPPATVASFLQRVGRGNRRTGRARLVGCYSHAGELARFEHLAAMAARLELCAPPHRFRPSVLVQQAGSLLCQSPSRWITAQVLHQRLPAFLGQACRERKLEDLLAHLAAGGQWLVPGRGRRYTAGPLLNKYLALGLLHSNLSSEPAGMEVVDEDTGQRLGEVAEVGEDRRMAIGGRGRSVVRISEGKVFVKGHGGRGAGPTFAPRGPRLLSREMALSLARHLGLPDGFLTLVEPPGALALVHFEGSLRGELLARLLRAQGWHISRSRAFALHLDARPREDHLPALEPEQVRAEVAGLAPALGRLADAGPFHSRLPPAWQRDLADDLLPAEPLAHRWSEAPLTPATALDKHLREVLEGLAGG